MLFCWAHHDIQLFLSKIPLCCSALQPFRRMNFSAVESWTKQFLFFLSNYEGKVPDFRFHHLYFHLSKKFRTAVTAAPSPEGNFILLPFYLCSVSFPLHSGNFFPVMWRCSFLTPHCQGAGLSQVIVLLLGQAPVVVQAHGNFATWEKSDLKSGMRKRKEKVIPEHLKELGGYRNSPTGWLWPGWFWFWRQETELWKNASDELWRRIRSNRNSTSTWLLPLPLHSLLANIFRFFRKCSK